MLARALIIGVVVAVAVGEILSRHRRLAYLDGSGMGLFLALAIPIDVPRKNVFIAYNFEANYVLPNETSTERITPNVVTQSRSFNRTLAYKVFESKIENQGFPGRTCLLRMICETSAASLEHNGLLGEIIHVVLTPSSSIDEGLPNAFSVAEHDGRTTGDCNPYHRNCPISFMDFISRLDL